MAYCLMATHANRDLAMDLTQEAFIRAFKGLPGLKDPARFQPWLLSIAVNVCRTRWARESRYREVSEAFLIERGVHVDHADDKLQRQARDRVVRRVLEGIEDAQVRSIVLLKYTDPEHTTRQIAEKLGVPHGTVTVKLMRFRTRIKEVLIQALADEAMHEA